MLQVIGAVLHVCAQLLVRIVLDAPAVDQRSDERAKRRQQVHISSGCVLSADAIAAARRFPPSACWRRRLRPRSGERRVGEEGRSRGGPDHLKKKKRNCCWSHMMRETLEVLSLADISTVNFLADGV